MAHNETVFEGVMRTIHRINACLVPVDEATVEEFSQSLAHDVMDTTLPTDRAARDIKSDRSHDIAHIKNVLIPMYYDWTSMESERIKEDHVHFGTVMHSVWREGTSPQLARLVSAVLARHISPVVDAIASHLMRVIAAEEEFPAELRAKMGFLRNNEFEMQTFLIWRADMELTCNEYACAKAVERACITSQLLAENMSEYKKWKRKMGIKKKKKKKKKRH